MTYVLGGLAAVAGYFIAKDAEKQGMNPWIWGIVTFFFPVVSTILYFMIRKSPKSDIKTKE
ncbi:MAG: hypothetical protein GY862_39030 [Gammaproteobacteria bacterium]|nr:hypothetical protein [Gammaproteobacteria bacterium]